MLFARNVNKISEFHMIFARKMPEFYIIIARKFCPRIFFLGGGHVPHLPPVSNVFHCHGGFARVPSANVEQRQMVVDLCTKPTDSDRNTRRLGGGKKNT